MHGFLHLPRGQWKQRWILIILKKRIAEEEGADQWQRAARSNYSVSPILRDLHQAPSSVSVSICQVFCSVSQPFPRGIILSREQFCSRQAKHVGCTRSNTHTHTHNTGLVLAGLTLSKCKSNRSVAESWISQPDFSCFFSPKQQHPLHAVQQVSLK